MEILDSLLIEESYAIPLNKMERLGTFFIDFMLFGLLNLFLCTITLDLIFVPIFILIHKDSFYTSSITRYFFNIKILEISSKTYASPYRLVARNLIDLILSAPFLLIPNIIAILFSPQGLSIGEILTNTQLTKLTDEHKSAIETAPIKKAWKRKFIISLSVWLGITVLLNITKSLY